MKLREIMERARLAQLNPLQLALFPPRLDPWETCEHEASYLQPNGQERQIVCLGCGAELDTKEISC